MKGPGGGTQNYTFVGTPNDGNYTTEISAGKLSLIGNPYPSALNANQFIEDNDASMIGTLYFWEMLGDAGNHNLGGYVGGYSIRNRSMGIAANTDVTGTAGLGDGTYHAPGQYIAVGQGFFVGSSTGGTITFNNGQRFVQVIDGSNSLFFRVKEEDTSIVGNKAKPTKSNKINSSRNFPQFKLGFEYQNPDGKDIHRQIGLTFKATNSFAFENGYDSFMFDLQPTDMYFKFVDDPSKYVIAGIGAFEESLEIPLGIDVAVSSNLNFMIDFIDNLDSNLILYLKDAATNTFYNLSEGVKTLNLEAGIHENRFFITFGNSDTSLGIDDLTLNKVLIYFDRASSEVVIKQNNLIIQNATLFNILGQKTYSWNSVNNSDEIRLALKNISSGIYIINLNTDKGIVTKKIFVNK